MDNWSLESDCCELFFSDFLAKKLLALTCNRMKEQAIGGQKEGASQNISPFSSMDPDHTSVSSCVPCMAPALT